MQIITIDDIAESHNYLRALNAELLIVAQDTLLFCRGDSKASDRAKDRQSLAIKARAVIAKAKELEL